METQQLNKDEIRAMGEKLGSGIKTEEELGELTKTLRKAILEAALGGEITEHLGYEKHSVDGNGSGNSRNGKSKKILKGDHGEVELALYAKGMSTRDIVATFKELYDADISPALVSRGTDQVLTHVQQWQNRELDPIYPIVYLDCIVLKIRENQRVIKRSMYVALGVNLEGHKELLGLWLADTEGAKFWLSVLTELRNRGVEDILIACVDGLKGFPEAIASEYPQTQVQLCIVHMVRNSLRFVPWKDYKAVTAELKTIYQANTEELALQQLDSLEKNWGEQYPQIIKSWRDNWENVATLFHYPPDIRKAIYTTNAIESLNSVIRKATKQRKVFPTNQSAMKVVYLAITAASKKWTMPIRNWKPALNRFTIEFGERITAYL